MSYKVLYRKYRPDSFDNIVGQDYTVKMLKNAIITGKNAHAYIFTGPRGTGKTSSAKVFAKALNCEHPIDGNPCNECDSCKSFNDNADIIEIDAASNNGVDEIRELINNVKLVPSNSKFKIYIIDEVHMLSISSFNALLLTLEEPPSHVVFILATTDIQKVPITILSRCQRFDFRPISKEAIINRLKYVCSEENIKITDDALNEIAIISAGGMRDALGMLDQLSSDDNEITLDDVSRYFGSVSVKKIDELLTAIEENNANVLLEILNEVKDSGTNYAVFIEKLISELRKLAIELKSKNNKHCVDFTDVYNMIFDLNECLCNININVDPYILIEIVLLKYINGNNDNKEIKKEDLLGNKSDDVDNSDVNYFPGNKNSEINDVSEKESKVIKDDVVEDSLSTDSKHNDDITKDVIDINIRVNNCFVDVSKDMKNKISKVWVDFMNYVMKKDRNLISLLADTIVLAASKSYVLIQSKIESTNNLINENINLLEKYFKDFSDEFYNFAAINENLWKKETEKYRFNLKNKIKYNYIEEKGSIEKVNSENNEQPVDELESLAKDVFGTFDIE